MILTFLFLLLFVLSIILLFKYNSKYRNCKEDSCKSKYGKLMTYSVIGALISGFLTVFFFRLEIAAPVYYRVGPRYGPSPFINLGGGTGGGGGSSDLGDGLAAIVFGIMLVFFGGFILNTYAVSKYQKCDDEDDSCKGENQILFIMGLVYTLALWGSMFHLYKNKDFREKYFWHLLGLFIVFEILFWSAVYKYTSFDAKP